MTLNEYQQAASRTIAKGMTPADIEAHALHGMVGEIGELHSLYQKRFQGHQISETQKMKETGDLLWFIAEYCTSQGWTLDEVAEMNIRKLIARYPQGFEAERSLHRREGDT